MNSDRFTVPILSLLFKTGWCGRAPVFGGVPLLPLAPKAGCSGGL
jgi:hypothetical protein